MTPLSPEERFTSRVADYVRHRPGYPRGIEAVLAEHAGLRSGSEVADIGSGTGRALSFVLERGQPVAGASLPFLVRRAG